MTSEGSLQRFFKAKAETAKILWRKIKYEGRVGCPDTIIVHKGRVIFVELKSPTGKGSLSKMQQREIKRLRDRGADVFTAQNREEVEDVIRKITDE
jgi:Holliday junction resolvase-like predicted endonuclease